MLNSMTGFGRASFFEKGSKIIIEIQSLNRKFLDISIAMPKELSLFEMPIRKKIAEKISRGQVQTRVWITMDEGDVTGAIPDITLMSELKKEYENLASKLSLSPDTITLPFLLDHLPTISTLSSLDKQKFFLHLEEALKQLIEMKQVEGEVLCQDLLSRLNALKKSVTQIETKAPEQKKILEKKLKEKIETHFPDMQDNEDRIYREIALYAEKADITEEVVRLNSHIRQMLAMLKKESASGRKLDFLLQEMQREVHTLNAKSSLLEISNMALEMKAELEKMKEQIQNIE